MTALFYKTFRESVGDFYGSINDSGGECVIYVRYETELLYTDFNGDAYTTFQQAVNAGYSTGETPRISSVIVFDSQTGMTSGHVGIVTAINGDSLTIRDSNWNLDQKITEHTIDTGNYDILGYVYHTP